MFVGRTFHLAARASCSARTTFQRTYAVAGGNTSGQAPDSSRKPIDAGVNAAQNPHLKHTATSSKGGEKEGKGNASESPELPSRRKEGKVTEEIQKGTSSRVAEGKKGFHTSAWAATQHTSDSYAKDVDTSPPQDGTTHSVSGDAQVSNKSIPREGSQLDNNPSQGGGKPQKEGVDKYQNVSKDEPYQPPAKEHGVGGEEGGNLRYGVLTRILRGTQVAVGLVLRPLRAEEQTLKDVERHQTPELGQPVKQSFRLPFLH